MNNRRTYSFPEKYTSAIETQLNLLGYSLAKPAALAQQVKKVSDLYADRQALSTLWLHPGHQAAYLAYFLPLNYLRLTAVLHEGQSLGFFSNVSNTIDFGSGPGTAHLAWLDSGQSTEHWTALEQDSRPVEFHKALLHHFNLREPRINPDEVLASPNTLGLFSYSLNEIDHLPEWTEHCSQLLFVEPSTKQQSRALMKLRQDYIDRGWFIWAPCTHLQHCPLLIHSKEDWCHDRIFVELPTWYKDLEKHLPLQNKTLTFSYLMVSRQPIKHPDDVARVIGDTLFEKGKTRQAICRNNEREYLGWLKRDGEAPQIPRGSLIPVAPHLEKKGNEIRGLTLI